MAVAPQVVAFPLYLGLMALELVEVRRDHLLVCHRACDPLEGVSA